MQLIELGAMGNYMQRQLSYDYNWNIVQNKKHLHSVKSLKLKTKDACNVCVSYVAGPDQIATTSLLKFITRFGSSTMVVYDALLSEKRILMAGQLGYSISSIIDFVLTAAALISPPFLGVQNKVFPHVHLKEIGKLL
jgi:Stabilization of polarity axis